MPAPFSDFLMQPVAGVMTPWIGVWVRLVSNNTGTAYVATAATDTKGKFTFTTIPGDMYTVYTGPTSSGAWSGTGDTSYAVPYVAGDDLAVKSVTTASSSPYGAFLPGAPTIPTPAGVTTGKVWDYGGRTYHVRAFNAKGDSVTDDTTALQAAINILPAGGGRVDIDWGVFVYTTLSYKMGLQLYGVGGTSVGAQSPATLLMQKSGTADVLLKPTALGGTSGVVVQDILFSAFQNQVSNTGGLNFLGTIGQCFRVQVTYPNNYAFQVKGGNVDNDTQNFTFMSCIDQNVGTGGATQIGYNIVSSTGAGVGSSPDGLNIWDCQSNTNGTWIRVDKGTVARNYGADVTCIGGRLLAANTSDKIINTDGYIKMIGNRFEITGGAGVLTVQLNATVLTYAMGTFIGNSYAAPGGLTFTDNGAMPANRIGEVEPGSVMRNQVSQALVVNRALTIGSAADNTGLTFKSQRIVKDNTIAAPLQIQDSGGNGAGFLNGAGSAYTGFFANNGDFSFLGHKLSTAVATPATSTLGANVTSVTFTGNDRRGTIAIVMAGALAANTKIATCTYATSYGATAPFVFLINQTAGVGLANVNFYRLAVSTGASFDLACDQALAAGTYTVGYIVEG